MIRRVVDRDKAGTTVGLAERDAAHRNGEVVHADHRLRLQRHRVPDANVRPSVTLIMTSTLSTRH